MNGMTPEDLPADSLVRQSSLRIDYLDSYMAPLHTRTPPPVEEAMRRLFDCVPAPFRLAMALREWVAARIGLKTAGGRQRVQEQRRAFTGAPGEAIGLFEVWTRNSQEILTGQRDSHLDFCLSFRMDAERNALSLTTAVQLHNRLGRLYFGLVKPFHRMMVPRLARRLAARLSQPSATP